MLKGHFGWIGTIVILIRITEAYGQSFSRSWYDAQKHCQSLGGSLNFEVNETDVDYYWKAYFIRQSMWIKLLGCYIYNDNVISMNEITEVTSLGMCQEYGIERKKHVFGIKNSKCACIYKPPSTSSLPPRYCNYKCSALRNMQTLPFNECGGQGTYNVYLSGNEYENQIADTGRNETCVAIQCGDDSKYLYENNCSLPYRTLCQTNGNEGRGHQSWKKSMEMCKASDSPSYLRGDFNLKNITQGCAVFRGQQVGPTWIGIANANYLSFDKKGLDLSQVTLVKCQKCSNSGCRLVNCSEPLKYGCTMVTTTTRKTQSVEISRKPRDNLTTAVTKSTRINTDATSFSISTKRTSSTKTTVSRPSVPTKITTQTESSGEEKETIFNIILIPISVSLPILLVVAVVMIVIIRRKRHSRNEKYELRQDDINQYSQVDKTQNKKQFRLEPQQSKYLEDPKDMKQSRTETPYIDKEEGVYDHLGESDPRRRVEEDTYDHTGFVVGRGDCDYDTTQSIKRQEKEDAYDLAGPISFDVGNADLDHAFNVGTEGSGDVVSENARTGDML